MEYKKDSVEEILDQLRTDRLRTETSAGGEDVDSILASLGFESAPKKQTAKPQAQQVQKPQTKVQPKP